MLPFWLYFVTGIITGFHVYTLLLSTLFGAPVNPLELISLLGSLCLLIAAYISLFKPQAAARLALIASLLMWCFYGPATANFLRTKFYKQGSASQVRRPVTGAAASFEQACILSALSLKLTGEPVSEP